MSKKSFVDTVNQIIEHAKGEGIIHHTTSDTELKENFLTIENRKVINFGSCSYLGLEFSPAVKNAAIEAIKNYGTQFSSSRAYVSPLYYEQLENKLSQIFDAPTVVTPTTTLGHIAAIPVLISDNDAIIVDHQAHSSIQSALNHVKIKGTRVELLRHNRMDLLENRIKELRMNHDKVWYMADGIYSMYGDEAPIDAIYRLLDKYDAFHFYVDDAHGMSCFGDKGQGSVLNNRKIHEKMIMATSFAKGFASGGGALIFPNKKLAQKVRNCGGPMITSGPMQPAALGAANAVADLHLSGEIKTYQEELKENIKYTHLLLKKLKLPILSNENSPIFFVGVSLPKLAYSILDRMKRDGFFLNLGIFPAVPIKNTGIRFTITRLHTFEQIQQMVSRLSFHFKNALKEENISTEYICKAFKIKSENHIDLGLKRDDAQQKQLDVALSTDIENVNQADWDSIFKGAGTYDYNGLRVMQKSFSGHKEAFKNLKFYYLLIKDLEGKIVLGTFLTQSFMKDDMLSMKSISAEIEQKRQEDPYFMTSKTLSTGSPVSEGNHLYVDLTSSLWKTAMDQLMKVVNEIQEHEKITSTIFRDFDEQNKVLDDYFLQNGFFKMNMPENCKVTNMPEWRTRDEFYSTLTKKKKGHFRRNILRHTDDFNVKIESLSDHSAVKLYYDLYLNVKQRSLEVNTFTLPYSYFENIAKNEKWEIISLYLKNNDESEDNKPVAAGFCYKGGSHYSFAMVGLNYDLNRKFNCYRQMLWQVVKRANELSYRNINMGFTSVIEKKHFGAKVIQPCAYMQINDNYKLEALATVSTTKRKEDGVNERRVLSI